jgi:hypothetical protein
MTFSAFVINLERRPDRRDAMLGRAQKLDFELVFVSAVDGKTLQHDILTNSSTSITHAEMACWLSHVNALELASKWDGVSMVLEDDAKLPRKIHKRLRHWISTMHKEELDLLQVGFCFGRPSLLGHLKVAFYRFMLLIPMFAKRMPNLILGDFGAGTHAYLVNGRAAGTLKVLNTPPPDRRRAAPARCRR